VLSANVLELSAARRTVDLVLVLKRRGSGTCGTWSSSRGTGRTWRCGASSTRRGWWCSCGCRSDHGDLREAPAPRELAFQERLLGRVVHERRFATVRLWERDAKADAGLGPGGAALAGLLDKGNIRVIGRASRQIRSQAPKGEQPDLLTILRALCQGTLHCEQLARVIPKEVVMASSLYKEMREWAREMGVEEGLAKGLAEGRARGLSEGRAKGLSEGRARGLSEGRLAEARLLCVSIVKRHHALVASRVLPVIEACTDVARLHRWRCVRQRSRRRSSFGWSRRRLPPG